MAQNNPYTRMSDWAGDYKADVPAVFAAVRLLVRLTDDKRDPLPGAKCYTSEQPGEKPPTCDDKGIAKFRLQRRSQDEMEILWQPANGKRSGNYFWQATFHIKVRSLDDEACQRRLANLGFDGDTIEEQVAAYQSYVGRTPITGRILDIRDELAAWHEGGARPGWQKPAVPKKEIPSDWVMRVRRALTGQNDPSQKQINEVVEVFGLGKKANQIGDLKKTYAARYQDAKLEDEIYTVFKDSDLKRVLPLYYGDSTRKESSPDQQPYSYEWADRLNKAFNDPGFLGLGFGGTDEKAVFEVLGLANSNGWMQRLNNDYDSKYSEMKLEDELFDELSGEDLRTALRLYYGGLAAEEGQPPSDVAGLSDEGLVPCAGFCHGTLAPRFSVLVQSGWQNCVDPAVASRIQKLRDKFGSTTPFGRLKCWFPPLFGPESGQEVGQRMQDIADLIDLYDRALPWEDKTDMRDYLVRPLLDDIIKPLIKWLPVVPDSLKKLALDGLPDALKDAIGSGLAGAVQNQQNPLDGNTKSALENILKSVVQLTSTRRRPGKPANSPPPWAPSNERPPTQSSPTGPPLPTFPEPTWFKLPVIEF